VRRNPSLPNTNRTPSPVEGTYNKEHLHEKQSKRLFPAGVVWFCRIAVGLLFIFSGLIKANDPLGFSYKLEEYFEVFHMLFLSDFALSIAILLCALEMILGFALLIGCAVASGGMGLIAADCFLFVLTFYSAYFKVVQSCGCFGDAIPLTPWQSFSKDMVLLALVLVLFVSRMLLSRY
jgi:hypothetical protein